MIMLLFMLLLMVPTQTESSIQAPHREQTPITTAQRSPVKTLRDLKKQPYVDIKIHSTTSAKHDYIVASNDVYGSGL